MPNRLQFTQSYTPLLLIDTEQSQLQTVERWLRQYPAIGCHTVMVTNAQDLSLLIPSQPPFAMIFLADRPHRAAFCESLRRLPACVAAPMVLMCANANTASDAHQSGIDKTLLLPMRPAELIQVCVDFGLCHYRQAPPPLPASSLVPPSFFYQKLGEWFVQNSCAQVQLSASSHDLHWTMQVHNGMVHGFYYHEVDGFATYLHKRGILDSDGIDWYQQMCAQQSLLPSCFAQSGLLRAYQVMALYRQYIQEHCAFLSSFSANALTIESSQHQATTPHPLADLGTYKHFPHWHQQVRRWGLAEAFGKPLPSEEQVPLNSLAPEDCLHFDPQLATQCIGETLPWLRSQGFGEQWLQCKSQQEAWQQVRRLQYLYCSDYFPKSVQIEQGAALAEIATILADITQSWLSAS